uniref:Reverse transcriptase domain-containing protein n=1 Tax=Tanacetum cinerariifolium TaxID=118510 RepID=A0A699KN72_TANCI|nr:reverse transcriptase domain-containing protein [Tanacetum cinerariifolium]
MSRSSRYGRSPSVFSTLRQWESSTTRQRSPVCTTVFTRLGARDKNVFTRLREKKRDIHSRLGPKVTLRQKHASDKRRECQPKTQTIEGNRQGTSSAAMSHAPAKNRGKSKKNGTRPTEQTADGPLELEIQESPMVIEVEDHLIHRTYVDGGSASEVLYEHCFNRLRPEVKSRMTPATATLLGFNEEISWPLGQISLTVSLGDGEHSTSVVMNFMVDIRDVLLLLFLLLLMARLGGSSLGAFATILHSVGIMVLLYSVTVPPFTGNLSIP